MVQRQYDNGRLVSDVEKAPDGTVVKQFAWTWMQMPTWTRSGIKYKWTSLQTKQIGRNCYDLKMPAGFSLYSWNDAKTDGGAILVGVGEWGDGQVVDPLQEAARKASEETKKLEAATIKLMPKILAEGKKLVSRIAGILPTLGDANAALKAIRQSAQHNLPWAAIGEKASQRAKTIKSTAENLAAPIKNAVDGGIKTAADIRDSATKSGQTALAAAKGSIDSAKTNIATSAKGLQDEAKKVEVNGKQAWENGKAAAGKVVDVIKGAVSEDLFKIEADSVGKLSFNFATGGYYADFELLAGLKVDSEAFKALMTGDFKLPEIDPLTAGASLSGLKTSVTTNYDAGRQDQYEAHGGANVYFASKRFAEWAGPGTLARAVALAIAGDGGQILQEAKSHLSLELEDLATWLQQRGATDASKLAVQILRAIVDQTSLDLPELSLKVTPVNFTCNYSVGGAVGAAGGTIDADTSTSATASHFGFSIVWKGTPGGDPLLDSINKLESMKLQGGMEDFNALAMQELDKLNIPGSEFLKEILLTGHVGVDSDNALDKSVVNQLSDMLSVDAAELLAEYKTGNPIIDLSHNSRIKDGLISQLKKLAVGNQKSAEVTKLQFNLNTMAFEVEFVIHHKYASGSLADIGKQLAGMVS